MFGGSGVGDRVGGAEMMGVAVGNQPAAGCLVEPLAVTTVCESELLHAAAITPATPSAVTHRKRGRTVKAYRRRLRRGCLALLRHAWLRTSAFLKSMPTFPGAVSAGPP